MAERIKSLYETQKVNDPLVFTETIKIDDAELRTVVSHLESISLLKTDLDTKGVAFETFMKDFFEGDAGQYFTPREIVEFAIKMVQIPDEPIADKIILDPACGSGGFLLYAMNAARHEAPEYQRDRDGQYKHWHDFAKERLFGIEINEEIARVAKMNMILHDDGHSNVIGVDSLDRLNRIQEVNRGFKANHFDLILTNPPFGAQVVLAERPYLADYAELGNTEDANGKKKARKNQKTEILFLERIWHFLKPKTGRAAVVLPDGILTNSSLQYVREFLLEHFHVQAVVSLPATAFSHYGAGVKSSLVFLRKRAEDEKPDDNEAIFMAVPELIGYDATGRKCDNQLPEIAQQFREFQKEAKPFFV